MTHALFQQELSGKKRNDLLLAKNGAPLARADTLTMKAPALRTNRTRHRRQAAVRAHSTLHPSMQSAATRGMVPLAYFQPLERATIDREQIKGTRSWEPPWGSNLGARTEVSIATPNASLLERYHTCRLRRRDTAGDRGSIFIIELTQSAGVVCSPRPRSFLPVLLIGLPERASTVLPCVMPEPAAEGNWGLTSLTGFLEGSVLDVFAANPAEKAKGAAGEEGGSGAGASASAAASAASAGSMQVQQQTPLGLSQQQLCGATATSKPGRMVSSASLESDLPELGRLERTKAPTPMTSVPTSDEEACRGSGEVVVSFQNQIHSFLGRAA